MTKWVLTEAGMKRVTADIVMRAKDADGVFLMPRLEDALAALEAEGASHHPARHLPRLFEYWMQSGKESHRRLLVEIGSSAVRRWAELDDARGRLQESLKALGVIPYGQDEQA